MSRGILCRFLSGSQWRTPMFSSGCLVAEMMMIMIKQAEIVVLRFIVIIIFT